MTEDKCFHAKDQLYVEAVGQKELCFFLYFNNMKKYLGALRSRDYMGVCDSAGDLLGGLVQWGPWCITSPRCAV